MGAAVAVDAGEGGVDVVHDTDVFVDAYLDAAEAAVDIDDGAVADVGMAQVEVGKAERGAHIGPHEGLSVEAIVLLAEADVDFVLFVAVEDDGVGVLGGVAVAGGVLLAEEEEGDAPDDGDEAEHVLPDVVPGNDGASGEEEQYADAEAYDGAGLILVAEDVDEAGDDDEERPPAFEADVDDVEELQGPDDAEGQEGDAADDFACAFH